VLTSPFSLAWWLANGAVLYTSWGLAGIGGLFLSLVVYSVLFYEAFRWLGARAAKAALGVTYGSVAVLGGSRLYVAWVSLRLLTRLYWPS